MANSKQITPLCFWKSINSIQTQIWNFATNFESSFPFTASVNCYLGEDSADALELWCLSLQRGELHISLAFRSLKVSTTVCAFAASDRVKERCKVDKWCGVKERSLSFLLILQKQTSGNTSFKTVLVLRWVTPAVWLEQVVRQQGQVEPRNSRWINPWVNICVCFFDIFFLKTAATKEQENVM